MKVSDGSVKRAKKVIADGASEVQQAVEQGELPVSVASDFVKAVPDKKQQTEIVSKGADAVRQAVKETKTVPSIPKDVTKNNKSVDEFLIVWGNANSTGKRAIWLWLCDNYEGAT